MRRPRIGFVTGIEDAWQHRLFTARRRLLEVAGIVPPDVYELPRFLDARRVFLRNGQRIDPAFDLILSELNATDAQLDYLDALVAAGRPPVAVIPGPPEILEPRLGPRTRAVARRILANAAHVLAYSDETAAFADDLAGMQRAQVIPWPFDAAAVRTIAAGTTRAATRRVVLNVPLRFHGLGAQVPALLKTALAAALADLTQAQRSTLSFHTFVYTDEDRDAYYRTGFADGLACTLERRRSFPAFVRFMASADAVINVTPVTILGRITFLAAALGTPAVVSSNVRVNRHLYPTSSVELDNPSATTDAMRELLGAVASGHAAPRFMPDAAAAERMGNFAMNARRFAEILGR